jgi:hypothetical protein
MKSFIEFINLQEVIAPDQVLSNISLWIKTLDKYIEHLNSLNSSVQNLSETQKAAIENAITNLEKSKKDLEKI